MRRGHWPDCYVNHGPPDASCDMGPDCGTVTPETLTDAQIRDHLAWLQAGQYKHGQGPGPGIERREAIAICLSALNPYCHKARRDEARRRICAAINARASKESP